MGRRIRGAAVDGCSGASDSVCVAETADPGETVGAGLGATVAAAATAGVVTRDRRTDRVGATAAAGGSERAGGSAAFAESEGAAAGRGTVRTIRGGFARSLPAAEESTTLAAERAAESAPLPFAPRAVRPSDEPAEPDGSASSEAPGAAVAIPAVATTATPDTRPAPTPKATARPPTRPTYFEALTVSPNSQSARRRVVANTIALSYFPGFPLSHNVNQHRQPFNARCVELSSNVAMTAARRSDPVSNGTTAGVWRNRHRQRPVRG